MTTTTISTQRAAYQIKWLIDSTAGECTVHDMAELTGLNWRTCNKIAFTRGWRGMYRRVAVDINKGRNGNYAVILSTDSALDALWGSQ